MTYELPNFKYHPKCMENGVMNRYLFQCLHYKKYRL